MGKQNAIPGTLTGGFVQPDRSYIVDDSTIVLATVEIDTAAVDSGNTDLRTTYLRAGLGLGKVTASGKYKEYDDGDTDGTEDLVAILNEDVDMLDINGTALAGPIMATVVIAGYVDADKIIGIDANGKADLRLLNGWFLLEDF